MKRKHLFRFSQMAATLLILLLSTALIAGCGLGGPGSPASTPTTAVEEPEDEPTEEPEDEPTEESSTGTADELAQVEIEDLEPYSYPSGLFSIDIPGNWSSSDQSDETLKRVIFTDPYNNAAIAVVIIPTGGNVAEEDLADLLIQDAETAFGEQENFELGETEPQDDGSVRLIFTYEATTEGVTATALGNSFAQLDGDYATLLYVIVPQEQFEDLQPDITDVINSLEVDSSVPLEGEGMPEDSEGSEGSISIPDDTTDSGDSGDMAAAGDLQTYTHSSGLFSMDVPADWNIQDASQPGQVSVNFSSPDQLVLVSVSISDAPTELTEENFADLLDTFAQGVAGDSPDLQQNEEVVPQSDGSFLLTFTYTDDAGSTILANSFMQQNDDKLTILSILEDEASQTDERDELLNTVINSYQIDPSVALP